MNNYKACSLCMGHGMVSLSSGLRVPCPCCGPQVAMDNTSETIEQSLVTEIPKAAETESYVLDKVPQNVSQKKKAVWSEERKRQHGENIKAVWAKKQAEGTAKWGK